MDVRRFPRQLASALGGVLLACVAVTPVSAQAIIRLNDSSFAQSCAAFASQNATSDNAITACNRAITREGLSGANLLVTRLNRGHIYLRRSDPTSALRDFDAVIEVDPRHAQAWLNRGIAYLMLDRSGEAVAAFTEALSLGVNDPHIAYYDRAVAREALGDLRGAYEDYSTALEIRPDWGLADAELQRLARTRYEWLASVLPGQND